MRLSVGARAGAHGRDQVPGVQGRGWQLCPEQGPCGEGSCYRLRGLALTAARSLREEAASQLPPVRPGKMHPLPNDHCFEQIDCTSPHTVHAEL